MARSRVVQGGLTTPISGVLHGSDSEDRTRAVDRQSVDLGREEKVGSVKPPSEWVDSWSGTCLSAQDDVGVVVGIRSWISSSLNSAMGLPLRLGAGRSGSAERRGSAAPVRRRIPRFSCDRYIISVRPRRNKGKASHLPLGGVDPNVTDPRPVLRGDRRRELARRPVALDDRAHAYAASDLFEFLGRGDAGGGLLSHDARGGADGVGRDASLVGVRAPGAVFPRAVLRVSPPRGPGGPRGALPDAPPRARAGPGAFRRPGRTRRRRRDAGADQGGLTALGRGGVRAGRAFAGGRGGAGQRRGRERRDPSRRWAPPPGACSWPRSSTSRPTP